jgi:hypothetical protein
MEPLFKAFKLTKAPGEEGTGQAIIATLGIPDHDDDVLLPGVFGKQSAKLIPTHSWDACPLGRAMITEKGNEAVADFSMYLDIPVSKDWHTYLKRDFESGTPLAEWSWGFSIKPGAARDGEIGGKRVRFLGPLPDGSPGVEVFEVSPVLKGAGIGTRTIGMKSRLTFADEIAQARAMLTSLRDRTKQVAELRAKEGKSFSAERAAELASVKALLEEIGVLAVPAAEIREPDAASLVADFERIQFELRRISA